MKTKLLTLFMFLIVSSTQVLAARVSISGLQQQINQLSAQVNQLESDLNTSTNQLFNMITALDQENKALIATTAIELRMLKAQLCGADTPPRFVDNGDGTICDNQTGLMWEMKDASDGTADLNNPNDVDNAYSWTSTLNSTVPDGTAFTDFLARLNNTVASSATDVPFAGHTDWRLPTSAELQTIVDCSFSLCIDPIFGPPARAFYWSSTSSASNPVFAWNVFFLNGVVFDGSKSSGRRVRAVRGGR